MPGEEGDAVGAHSPPQTNKHKQESHNNKYTFNDNNHDNNNDNNNDTSSRNNDNDNGNTNNDDNNGNSNNDNNDNSTDNDDHSSNNKQVSAYSPRLSIHGWFLVRRQRGHSGVVLPLVVSNSAKH